MHKQYILPALGVLCVIIILMYSVEAAFTVLGGIAAVLFGDNRRKRTEIEIKTDARRVILPNEISAVARVAGDLVRVNLR
tara:strand:+ start:237 stop:476 length:240 start_codon:yes stop_codon:yes gene_type:complete